LEENLPVAFCFPPTGLKQQFLKFPTWLLLNLEDEPHIVDGNETRANATQSE